MACILLVEDGTRDALILTQVAGSVGITDIYACLSLKQGVQYLEAFLRGESPRPFAIVVDLDLGFESGYELLRFRYSSSRLRTIPTIVWTTLDESARNVCEPFDVTAIVFKWEGASKLREALEEIIDKEQLIPFSKNEPILRTVKGATIYSRDTGFYRVSLKGNIFNQEYGDIGIFRGVISDKTKQQSFGNRVQITRGNSAYDINLDFDASTFKNDFKDDQLTYVPIVIKTKFPYSDWFHWVKSALSPQMRDVTYTFTLQLLPRFPISEYKLIEMNEEPTVDRNNLQTMWGPDSTVGGCGNSGCNTYILACAEGPAGSEGVQVVDHYDSALGVGYGTWEFIKPIGSGFCQNFHQQSHNTARNVRIRISYYPPDTHLVSHEVDLQEVDAKDVAAKRLAFGRLYVGYFNNKQKSYRLRLTMFTGEPMEATPELQTPQTKVLTIRESQKSDAKEVTILIQPDW